MAGVSNGVKKKKCTPLSIDFKRKVIAAVENNPTKKKIDIAKEFNIQASTLATILKNKEKYCGSELSSKCKRVKSGEFVDVDECVIKWLKMCRDKNVPIGGPVLQEKAQQFAEQLGHTNFRASNGWLHNFKKRNDIVFKKLCGESGSVDETVCQDWIENLLQHTEGYHPDDIFNADETGLFFKCLPDKTLSFKDEPCHGGKNSKERITVLLGSNSTGTVKLKPLVIGKSNRPRCFKNSTTLPTDYVANKKAWMTSDIFSSWLSNINRDMIKKNKHILMMIDNCTAHGDIPQLSNVKVQFLPPNTTSKLQPLDQGIIKNFKSYYRKEVVRRFLSDLDNKSPTKINLLDAMWMLTKAWQNVSKTTISNCFKKSGFKIIEEDVDEPTPLPIDVAPRDWTKVRDELDLQELEFEDFVTFDDDVAVCGEVTENDILSSVGLQPQPDEEMEQDDEEADNGEDDQQSSEYTVQDARKSLNVLKCLFTKKDFISDEVVKCINVLDSTLDTIHMNTGKQSKINDFFKSSSLRQ